MSDFRDGQGKFVLKRRNISLSRVFKGHTFKYYLNGWEAINYIFLDKKFHLPIKTLGEI